MKTTTAIVQGLIRWGTFCTIADGKALPDGTLCGEGGVLMRPPNSFHDFAPAGSEQNFATEGEIQGISNQHQAWLKLKDGKVV